MRSLFVLNKYFWKYRLELGAGLVFVLLSNWFRIQQPQLVRQALDAVVAQLKTLDARGALHTGLSAAEVQTLGSSLSYFGLLVLGCALLMGVFMYFMRQMIIVMSRRIEFDQREELFAHFTQLPTAFYKRNKIGDLMSRMVEDVNKVRMYVGPAIMYFINTVSLFAFVIYSMVKVSPTLTLWALLPLPFLAMAIFRVSSLVNRQSRAVSEQLSTLTSTVQEAYSGIRVLKSYAIEETMATYFGGESEEFKKRSLRRAQTDAFFSPLITLLIGLSTIIAVWAGGLEVIAGRVTIGNIAEFVLYVGMLAFPVISLGWLASLVQSAAASQKRINEFLNITPDIESPAAANAVTTAIKGSIEFRNVSFTYPDTGIVALKNVSLTLRAGEKLAIVGRTGSGKTTFAELLNRMYDVTEGEILIDGIDIRRYHLPTLRSAIGYVPQDVFLFSDTIHNNVAFGVTAAEREAVEMYTERAGIVEEIRALPQGFDTIIGERGVTLSGGQKQRTAIARALIKQPAVLLLDDSLSAVDTRTEQRILDYLGREMHDRTTIVVTHRVHFLHSFDQVIVLEQGQVVEQGKPADLAAAGGYYAELIERQQLEEV